jgi:CRISPR-associated endonuclease/helicase Cas3
LLAKSHDGITLTVHTDHVLRGCEVFFNLAGVDVLRMYRVAMDPSRFLTLLKTAALFHDFGKANDHFQAMLQTGEILQAYRHEAVSYAAMNHPEIRDWLLQKLTPGEFDVVSAAVAGHHRKFPKPTQPHPSGLMTMPYDHPEVGVLLDRVAALLDLSPRPVLKSVTYDVAEISMGCFGCEIGEPCGECPPRLAHSLRVHRVDDPQSMVLAAALKASLIMGDVLGSIQDKTPESLEEDLLTILSSCFSEEMADRIIRRKQQQSRVQWELNRLQQTIGDDDRRVTFVESGCGAGKTVTAYRWARRHAHLRKLYFCYPTMGTATAGYTDYIQYEQTSLVHSTAHLELQRLKSQSIDQDPTADQQLVQTFRALGYPGIACTADTVLGLLQNYHLGILGCAGIAAGSFVFDEIHSYDPMMWKALLRFIQFDVPCLLMTASLPAYRLDELKKALAVVGDDLHTPDSRGEMEAVPRYHLPAPMTIEDDPWSEVEGMLREGRNVLWVSNTVESCIQRYEEAVRRGLRAVCYHSRFKQKDRIRNEQAVIDGFRNSTGFLAFTTQVAEMSLDITSDVMITDVAPISALIQRLGRLNRDLLSDIAVCHVLKPGVYPNGKRKSAPYEEHEIEEAVEWLSSLPDKPMLSQDDLIGTWRAMDVRPAEVEVDPLRHLDDVMTTEVGSLRKTDGVNIEIVFAADVERIGAGESSVNDESIRIHVYKPKQYADWKPYLQHTMIPPDDVFTYNPERGAKWNNSRTT